MQNVRKQVFYLALLFSIANIEFSYAIWGSKKQEKTTKATTEKEKIRASMSQYAEKCKEATSDIDYQSNKQKVEKWEKRINSCKQKIDELVQTNQKELFEKYKKIFNQYADSCKGDDCNLKQKFNEMFQITYNTFHLECSDKNQQIMIDQESINNAKNANLIYEIRRNEEMKKLRDIVQDAKLFTDLAGTEKVERAEGYIIKNSCITDNSTVTLHDIKTDRALFMLACGFDIAEKKFAIAEKVFQIIPKAKNNALIKELNAWKAKIAANPQDLTAIGEYYQITKSLYENVVIDLQNKLTEMSQNDFRVADIVEKSSLRTDTDELTCLIDVYNKAQDVMKQSMEKKERTEKSDLDDSESAV